ncbi:MAG: hypothetical protein SFU91_10040 [Chloroherpetonaceae bacterium]|nr:hypothetical protein [Chloroherpetonaceae bacterium]
MRTIMLKIFLMLLCFFTTVSISAQTKTEKKGKTTVKVEKKAGENKDVTLKAIEIKITVPVPRIKFVMERVQLEANVDHKRFGDISYEINEQGRKIMHSNKITDRPVRISNRTLTSISR